MKNPEPSYLKALIDQQRESAYHPAKTARQLATELEIINSVQAGLVAQIDIQGIYDLVGEKIRQEFDAQVLMISTYDLDQGTGQPRYLIEEGMRIYLPPSPLGPAARHLLESHKTLRLNTPGELQAYDMQTIDGTSDVKSGIWVPLVVGGQIRGSISLQNIDREYAFSDSDVNLLETLANSMSLALESARLFAETQRLLEESKQRAAEMATVNTVSQALVAEPELDALIYLIGEQLRGIFDADIVYIALLDRETNLIHFPYNFGEEYTTITYGEGLTSKILESGQPLLINEDIDTHRKALGIRQVGRKARSYLGVPIFVGGQTIGAISVQSTQLEGRFSPDDVRLLSTIAANFGTAIRNASLFDEVKRQKTYYELIIANSPAAIVVIDHNLIVTGWNPAAERLFGYTREEAVGKNVDLLVANRPEILEEATRISEQGLRDNQIHFFSKRTRKDGSLVDVEAMGLPVIEDGQFTGYVVIYHDITELQNARQEAIRANEAKSAFLANMSHELRTPLNAIIGFTRIVRRKGETVLPEQQLENLDKVLVSAEHLLGLINSVLDISKIEAGRMDVRWSTFEIGPLIDMVIDTSQLLVRPEQVKLVPNVAQDIPPICSDMEKIRQILYNLLSNAAKFTPQGQIDVNAFRSDDMLVIQVKDTGIGIPPAALEHIFEEFQQADSSTTRQYGGTGLGLFISRNLAHMLDGDLTAESQEGLGSTFTLVLPLVSSALAGSVQARPWERAAIPISPLPGSRIV